MKTDLPREYKIIVVRLKNEANEHLKAKDFGRAREKYNLVCHYVNVLRRDMPPFNIPAKEKVLLEMELACKSNLVTVAFESKNYSQGIEICNEIIKIDKRKAN